MESTYREYQAITNNIRVLVTPIYIPEKSSPESNTYVFSYHVVLENLSESPVQLINRHWRIKSAGRDFADIKGEGVIGERPVLEPNGIYEYTSWTVIADAHGTMSGAYTFRDSNGSFFDVTIPEFDLIFFNTEILH